MKHRTILIATGSEIIALGLRTLLAKIEGQRIEAVHVLPSMIVTAILKESPAAVSVDVADATAIAEVLRLKSEFKTKITLIGFYHSALPDSTTSLFDAMISTYDSAEAINNQLKRTLSVESPNTANELTPREKEVIRGIVKGLSNKEIAEEIHVSVNTVMTHRRNIAQKLRIHSAAGLTIFAIVSKIVSLNEVKSVLPQITD